MTEKNIAGFAKSLQKRKFTPVSKKTSKSNNNAENYVVVAEGLPVERKTEGTNVYFYRVRAVHNVEKETVSADITYFRYNDNAEGEKFEDKVRAVTYRPRSSYVPVSIHFDIGDVGALGLSLIELHNKMSEEGIIEATAITVEG